MRPDVTRLDHRLRRRSTIGYALGIAAYTFVIVALYPQFRHDTGLDKLADSDSAVMALFGAAGSITTPDGWLNANLYANFAPLIVLLVTIGYGAMCIAGQNEDDTLALIVTEPLSRRSIVAQKMLALAFQAAVVAVAFGIVVVIGRNFELQIPLANVFGASMGVLLLGIDLGLLALLIGARTGSRGTALGVASVVAVVSYVVSSMAPVVSWLKPVQPLSLFYWAVGDNQLVDGLSASSWLVLGGVGVALALAANWAFDRLDVR
jgi:ABC-2 type transport system permease protein